jgi:two-component system, OmpR family, KDP operon response regulator KdpE
MEQPCALVLDDDAPLRRVLREALSSEGWLVRTAARNEMAMQLASLRRPDVVLLDVSKPSFAPSALATGLRIHYGPGLPILATSTTPAPDVSRQIGAYGFLQKPFELDNLMRLLDRGLSLAHRSEQLRLHSDDALARLRRLRVIRPDQS